MNPTAYFIWQFPVKPTKPGVAEWRYDFAGFLTEPQGFQESFHSQVQQCLE
jgi:hypothetical protein